MNFKRLTLTDIKIDIKRVPNKKTLVAAMEAAGMNLYSTMLRVHVMLVFVWLLSFYCCLQMLKANGKKVHGEESLS